MTEGPNFQRCFLSKVVLGHEISVFCGKIHLKEHLLNMTGG